MCVWVSNLRCTLMARPQALLTAFVKGCYNLRVLFKAEPICSQGREYCKWQLYMSIEEATGSGLVGQGTVLSETLPLGASMRKSPILLFSSLSLSLSLSVSFSFSPSLSLSRSLFVFLSLSLSASLPLRSLFLSTSHSLSMCIFCPC